ncbi:MULTISPECIES: helix-turn-helix transcriptional regulator [Erwinia]|uniref:helix-turn-helix transcriptional regulator n=1 Tax=Erwinia TaxID=551 RepID=UPI0010614C6F|nr:helix-turn-helix transcriptional regulator [Erwinia aphidicola]MCP2234058.1 transcriptional regulator with XRE-family HTH domain [Erwinia aphidicola]
MKVFSQKLQKVLHEQGISQSEFARLIGVTSQSVNGWCTSRTFPRSEVLEKIPGLTGKPLFWFFMTEEDEKNF